MILNYDGNVFVFVFVHPTPPHLHKVDRVVC